MSGALDPTTAPKFQVAAKALMGDSQLRKNVSPRDQGDSDEAARVVGEMPDWQELRESGKEIRWHTMRHLDFYLEQFERNCTAAGGQVHWAKDAEEARPDRRAAGEGERRRRAGGRCAEGSDGGHQRSSR